MFLWSDSIPTCIVNSNWFNTCQTLEIYPYHLCIIPCWHQAFIITFFFPSYCAKFLYLANAEETKQGWWLNTMLFSNKSYY